MTYSYFLYPAVIPVCLILSIGINDFFSNIGLNAQTPLIIGYILATAHYLCHKRQKIEPTLSWSYKVYIKSLTANAIIALAATLPFIFHYHIIVKIETAIWLYTILPIFCSIAETFICQEFIIERSIRAKVPNYVILLASTTLFCLCSIPHSLNEFIYRIAVGLLLAALYMRFRKVEICMAMRASLLYIWLMERKIFDFIEHQGTAYSTIGIKISLVAFIMVTLALNIFEYIKTTKKPI